MSRFFMVHCVGKYGDIQSTSLTPDRELNILIYWTSSYVIIYRSYKCKNVPFFGPPCMLGFRLVLQVVTFNWPTLVFSLFMLCYIMQPY